MNKTYKYILLPFLEGKPLEVGDKVDGYGQEGAEVVAIMSEKMVVVRSTVKGGYGYPDVAYPLLLWAVSELKRHHEPKPDVLDADGVPIKVGDTVYYVVEGTAYEVVGLHGGTIDVKAIGIGGDNATRWIGSKNLTHRQPDSLERIEEDARKSIGTYWGCIDVIDCDDCPSRIDGEKPYKHYGAKHCGHVITCDLLRRQRKILEYDEEMEVKGEESNRTD